MNWWLLRKSVVTNKCRRELQPLQNPARKAQGSMRGLAPVVLPSPWGHHKLPVLCWMPRLAGEKEAVPGRCWLPSSSCSPSREIPGDSTPVHGGLALALLTVVWGWKAEQCPRASPWLREHCCCTKLSLGLIHPERVNANPALFQPREQGGGVCAGAAAAREDHLHPWLPAE